MDQHRRRTARYSVTGERRVRTAAWTAVCCLIRGGRPGLPEENQIDDVDCTCRRRARVCVPFEYPDIEKLPVAFELTFGQIKWK